MTQKAHSPPAFKEFADDTTIHGIKDVATARNPFLTAIWAFLILGSTGAMIYEVYQTIFGFLDRPKATQIKQLFQDSYPFPPMVFCPQSWINASRVRQLGMTKDDVAYALSFMPMLRVQHRMNLTEDVEQRHASLMAQNGFRHLFDLYLAISVDSRDIIYCSTCKVWPAKKKMTEYGVCYQLILKDARRYNLDDFIFMPYFQYDPYEDKDAASVPPYSSYNSGEKLYIGINENDFFDGDIERMKQNTSYVIKIAPSKQKRLSGATCLTNEAFRLKNISQENCYCDCEQRVYGPACWGFVHLGYFLGTDHVYDHDNNTVPLWSSLIHGSLDLNVWADCQERERPRYDKCAARCMPRCEEWLYETTVLTVNGRRLMTHTEEAALTLVFSYQVKSGTVVVEEKATYTWHTFLSNIGGQMGLWLGISILSLCQLVFFIFRWVEYRLQERAKEAIAGHRKTDGQKL